MAQRASVRPCLLGAVASRWVSLRVVARLQDAYNVTYQILRPWTLDRSASSKPLRTIAARMPAHFTTLGVLPPLEEPADQSRTSTREQPAIKFKFNPPRAASPLLQGVRQERRGRRPPPFPQWGAPLLQHASIPLVPAARRRSIVRRL